MNYLLILLLPLQGHDAAIQELFHPKAVRAVDLDQKGAYSPYTSNRLSLISDDGSRFLSDLSRWSLYDLETGHYLM
jgi:hypothetical protein